MVIIRFGHDYEPNCMQMDEILASVSDQIKNFAVIYLVDISEVPDFNTMYELYDPCTTMFFFRCVWMGEGEGLCPTARAAAKGHRSVRFGFSTYPHLQHPLRAHQACLPASDVRLAALGPSTSIRRGPEDMAHGPLSTHS